MGSVTITPAEAEAVRNGVLVLPLEDQPSSERAWVGDVVILNSGAIFRDYEGWRQDVPVPIAPGDTVEVGEHSPGKTFSVIGTVAKVEVMRLREFWSSDRLNEHYQNRNSDDSALDWLFRFAKETMEQWNALHPSHPWESNPVVAVATMEDG